MEQRDVDLVIIVTPHDSLAEMSLAAINSGKHVLVEKPAARHVAELIPVIAAAQRARSLVRVGFNHRYHRAFRQAREIYDRGELGELMFVRARYGHGGRPGYEREWRAQPTRSGGADRPGSPILGRVLRRPRGCSHVFWEDAGGRQRLSSAQNREMAGGLSSRELRGVENLFSFEIYGRTAKLAIDGLRGSYEVEQLSHYKLLPEMGPPETSVWEYPWADDSWAVAFGEFLDNIRQGRAPCPGLGDAHAALSIVDRLYRGSGYDHYA